TVLGWLGASVPPQTVGAHVTRGNRGSLASTVQDLTGRDTAEQVWRDTHDEFFLAYLLADGAVVAAVGLAFWGAAPDQRRRRGRPGRLRRRGPPGRLRRRVAVAAARGRGRRGGRDLHGVRVGLAWVRRQGGRHHRDGALLPAAGHGRRRYQAERAPDPARR